MKPKVTSAKSVKKYAILFDMDGVLVDVKDSYRKAIQETAQFFTGKAVDPSEIQALKEKGGLNNDWDLTEAILVSRGKTVPKAGVIKKFQELYLGSDEKKGFIENEKWLLQKEKLVALHKQHKLGVVTGRPRAETLYVLKKFHMRNLFEVIVAMEDYPPEKAKPDPYPIKLAMEKLGFEDAVYVGDSVDDISAAKRAGVKAIGCIPPGGSASHLRDLLLKCGAKEVLSNINDVNKILP